MSKLQIMSVGTLMITSLFVYGAENIEAEAYQGGVTYKADMLKNTEGGVSRGSKYVDLLSIHGDVDTEKAWDHSGGTLHVDYLISRNTFNPQVGDAQVSSNIDFDYGEHLYEFWYEQQLSSNNSLKAGLYDINSEFDSIETAGLFINSSHGIGVDFSQSGASVMPITGVGLRELWTIDPEWKVLVAVMDGVPGDHQGNNHKTHVQLRKDEGAMMVGEINYQPQETTRIGLGSWYYTHEFSTFDGGHDHNNGIYTFIDKELSETESGKWSGFARIGCANDNVNQFGNYYGAGVVFTGSLINKDDQLGLAVASAHNGEEFLGTEKLAGNHWDHAETAVEFTYRSQLTPWLSLQPDVQYIINPGTDPSLDNALVIGLRIEVSLEK